MYCLYANIENNFEKVNFFRNYFNFYYKVDTIGLRIKYLRDLHFKGNNVKMASELGTSEANIRNYINGSYPKVEFIIAICEKLEINYEWIMTGRGETYVSGSNVVEKEKPSDISPDGLRERYISLLEKTVSSLEAKINELKNKV